MSLINEALKKARVEAAQRDAEQRGVLVPKAAALEPRRRTGRWAAIAVAALAMLGLAVAGGMWLAGRGAPGGPDSAPASAAEPMAAEVPGGPTGEPGSEAAVGANVPEPAAEAARGRPEPVDPPAVEASVEPAPAVAAAVPSPPAAEPAPPVPDPAPTRASPADPRSAPAAPAAPSTPEPSRRPASAPSADAGYLRKAPLPTGGTIRLDGIVWSETEPAAVIEGQVVGVGEFVHGARVVRVERHRVVLDAGGVELVIRLR